MSYVKPEEVTSPRDSVSNVEVLYDGKDGNCSIARLLWDGEECIGIRWNGTDESPNGYPSSFGYPCWVVLDDDAVKVISAYKLGLLPKVD